MAAALETRGAGSAREAAAGAARHISPAVRHELNNILTIIQGYTDRLLLKHGENPALEPQLKIIADAARRAATLVRSSATPPADLSPVPQPDPPAAPTATATGS